MITRILVRVPRYLAIYMYLLLAHVVYNCEGRDQCCRGSRTADDLCDSSRRTRSGPRKRDSGTVTERECARTVVSVVQGTVVTRRRPLLPCCLTYSNSVASPCNTHVFLLQGVHEHKREFGERIQNLCACKENSRPPPLLDFI